MLREVAGWKGEGRGAGMANGLREEILRRISWLNYIVKFTIPVKYYGHRSVVL